jgi:hypothetical protein
MAYEDSAVTPYFWAEDATFGATTVTHQIIGPRGKTGIVRDIACEITTSLVGSTTVPEIMVGISSGDFTFGRYRLGTAIGTGYGTGYFRASDEAITGNPPRTLSDFASHVVLDGGPLTSQGVAGGTYGTVVPAGRIPAGPLQVTNVISGASSTDRIFLNGLTAGPGGPIVGQKVRVSGVAGVNSTVNGIQTISAIDSSVPPQWIEVSGLTFSGAYTGGGLVMPLVIVTGKQGSGGSPAGGGIIRVEIQWIGPNP